MQRKFKIEKSKDEIHVLDLSVSEQVLLMTCKVKAIGPDGSSTIARALINLASSCSFSHERLAQHLRLPCGSKSARVEDNGETTMHTQVSIWLQVSGVEDDGEKIGVKPSVLK